MIKKKRILLSLIVVILCVCIAMCAFACNKDDNTDDDDDDTTEDTALFTNGTFKQFTKGDDDKYPVAPTSWTATPGSTSSSSTMKTPQGEDDISVGVISVNSKEYDQKTLGIGNPNKPEGVTDDYVLMIDNKVATAYSYVSSSATIEKNKYYKLSFWVKTVGLSPKNDGDDYGAYIYVKGSAYAEFTKVDTEGEWKQFNVYFRGSNSGDKTFTLTLGLGEGDYTNGHMVKGFAYFDDVVLTNLTDVAEGQTAYTEAEFNALQYTDTQAKCDMRTIDGNFNYVSSISTLPFYNISQLTGSAGSGSGTSASTGSTYLEKGILDMAKANNLKAFSGYSAEAIALTKAQTTDLGDKVVAIHNKQLTAYTYKDNVGMLIGSKKYYKVSIYAQTFLNDATKAGAYITLNSSSTELKAFENLNTNKAWTQYTFYIEGNQYSDNTLYVSMSLGKGGSGDNTWAQGVAFFDDLTYTEVSEADYTAATESATVIKYTYRTAEDDNDLRSLKGFVDTQYEESFEQIKGSIEVLANQSKFVDSTNTALDILKITNSKLTSTKASTIFKKTTSAYAKKANGDDDDLADFDASEYKTKYAILPNTAYKITMWVKTEDLNDGGSATVELFSYDKAKQTKYDDCKTSLTSISSLNDSTLESYMNETYDNYSILTFYVLGDVVDTNYIGLNITFGSGDAASKSAGLVSGKFYLTNLRVSKISYDDYSSASTGTTTQKHSFVGSGESGELSSNATFEFVDMTSTSTLYGDDFKDVYDATGKLVKNAVPTNWTITNSAALTQNGGASTAGVISIADYENKATYGIDAGIYDTMPTGLLTVDKNPNLLLIDAKNVTSLGYKSSSVSLSANSYYVFSVYGKSIDDTALSISVDQTGNTDLTKTTLVSETPGTGWKQYLVYVRTGITSTSVTVTLYAGSPLNTASSNFQALFTLATYVSIDETIYNKAAESATLKKIAWFTETMDQTSSAATDTDLATAANWTGAAVDSNASTASDDLAKGIFNQLNGNWGTINLDPDEVGSFAADKIFTDGHGDSVLVIYNKTATSYAYTSTSFSLEAGKYYKVSIDVLTKDIARLSKETAESDTDKYADWKDKNEYATATITLTANNKTYTFGKSVEKDKTQESFTGDTATADYNEYVLAKDRLVTPGEWTTYTYYIALADDVSETVSASLKLALGGKNVSYWETGYLFLDNFTVEEVEKDTYEANAPADTVLNPANEAYNSAIAANTYKISYTNEDAEAEEEADDDDDDDDDDNKDQKNWLWLYITSGVIGGILVIILVIYIIKKYAPKKGFKKAKKTLTNDNSAKGKFN